MYAHFFSRREIKKIKNMNKCQTHSSWICSITLKTKHIRETQESNLTYFILIIYFIMFIRSFGRLCSVIDTKCVAGDSHRANTALENSKRPFQRISPVRSRSEFLGDNEQNNFYKCTHNNERQKMETNLSQQNAMKSKRQHVLCCWKQALEMRKDTVRTESQNKHEYRMYWILGNFTIQTRLISRLPLHSTKHIKKQPIHTDTRKTHLKCLLSIKWFRLLRYRNSFEYNSNERTHSDLDEPINDRKNHHFNTISRWEN